MIFCIMCCNSLIICRILIFIMIVFVCFMLRMLSFVLWVGRVFMVVINFGLSVWDGFVVLVMGRWILGWFF